MRTLLRALVHDAFMAVLRATGMRDRLRCPRCRRVGTWKPHGGHFDAADVRSTAAGAPVRRWLCKWCGHYRGPEGTLTCHMQDGAWRVPGTPLDDGVTLADRHGDTPRDLLAAAARQWRGMAPPNPWGG
jgi:hypothetical protein